jgi:hypothetical protein
MATELSEPFDWLGIPALIKQLCKRPVPTAPKPSPTHGAE